MGCVKCCGDEYLSIVFLEPSSPCQSHRGLAPDPVCQTWKIEASRAWMGSRSLCFGLFLIAPEMKQRGRVFASSLPWTERLAYLARREQRGCAALRHSEVMSAGCEIGKDPENRSARWSVLIGHFLRPCHRKIPSYVDRESDRKHDLSRSHLPAAWLGRRHCCYVAGLSSLFGELRTSPHGS